MNISRASAGAELVGLMFMNIRFTIFDVHDADVHESEFSYAEAAMAVIDDGKLKFNLLQ